MHDVSAHLHELMTVITHYITTNLTSCTSGTVLVLVAVHLYIPAISTVAIAKLRDTSLELILVIMAVAGRVESVPALVHVRVMSPLQAHEQLNWTCEPSVTFTTEGVTTTRRGSAENKINRPNLKYVFVCK